METLTTKPVHDAIWGTPERCAVRIIDIHERVSTSQFATLLGIGSRFTAQIETSLRLYAEKVMPRVARLRKKEPVPA